MGSQSGTNFFHMVNIDVPAGVGAPPLDTNSETKKLLFKNVPMQGEGFLWELINTKKVTDVFLENIPGSYGGILL